MPKTTFNQIQTEDEVLRRVQANVSDALNSVQTGPFFGGSTLSVDLAVGDNAIAHKLNRIPQLWIVLDISAASNLFRTSWSQSQITINSSAICSAKLWVN